MKIGRVVEGGREFSKVSGGAALVGLAPLGLALRKEDNMLRRLAVLCSLGTLLFGLQVPVVYAQPDPPPDKPCPVEFVGPRISAPRGGYIEAEYGFDEGCRPVLIALRTGSLPIPKDEQKPIDTDTGDAVYSGSEWLANWPAPLAALAAATTNVCHTETWETDLVYLRTTQVQNDTRYTWTGSAITSWGVTATKKIYFTWWYISSGPSASYSWNPQPTNLTGKAKASFYCNGGPFCAGGPMYSITMNAYTYVNKSGGCSGSGTYSGTVIPGGHVLYRTWKD